MNRQVEKKYLVIGHNGKTGTRVYKKLIELGKNVTGASRNGETYFDWRKPETWAEALIGIHAIYLTYYPDLAIDEAPNDILKFCELAKQSGVQHITLLSGRGEPAAQICEDILKNSGLNWAIIRASWFNQNFSEGMFREFIDAGTIALPVGMVTEPFVDTDDICEVVVATLLDEKHSSRIYEVTGPELLCFSKLAETFSDVLERKIKFIEIPRDVFVETLQSKGVEPNTIEMLLYLFSEVLDGRNEYVTDGVKQALGRPAKQFRDFVADNKNLFSEPTL